MLPYPTATTREEKRAMINDIANQLLDIHGDIIIAVGAYGSIALEIDGPYSDIEMYVVTRDGMNIQGYEFIYGEFKIEIAAIQKSELVKRAMAVDDLWAIKAGSFIHVLAIYDPERVFAELKELPMQVSMEAIKDTMREFMIWEPYETMGKIRNNYLARNLNYIPMGVKDLVWQTTKLIGLANKQYFLTRAKAFEQSLNMESKPVGYKELVLLVMAGKLDDTEQVYQLCEKLWMGLNDWLVGLGIEYRIEQLPFRK
ncbi:kanamycin nucleotidyltransferase C-terminal domain-containing protein [Paenibacillus sp. 481]|uniref:kanamycin nucleotidyltransferase C-terminal domain-containing protein n=1 Tax=Paenibacillus sp. 481 TaxID=2835869 RepID=UPI001E4CB8EB|nr:kanamycin nucleotidyltransferase C-terminal domain-containing protein [Paenibacillus sp. 481]UHA73530.1 KNTase domain-containing protein [Paenibacillus sp. 481]